MINYSNQGDERARKEIEELATPIVNREREKLLAQKYFQDVIKRVIILESDRIRENLFDPAYREHRENSLLSDNQIHDLITIITVFMLDDPLAYKNEKTRKTIDNIFKDFEEVKERDNIFNNTLYRYLEEQINKKYEAYLQRESEISLPGDVSLQLRESLQRRNDEYQKTRELVNFGQGMGPSAPSSEQQFMRLLYTYGASFFDVFIKTGKKNERNITEFMEAALKTSKDKIIAQIEDEYNRTIGSRPETMFYASTSRESLKRDVELTINAIVEIFNWLLWNTADPEMYLEFFLKKSNSLLDILGAVELDSLEGVPLLASEGMHEELKAKFNNFRAEYLARRKWALAVQRNTGILDPLNYVKAVREPRWFSGNPFKDDEDHPLRQDVYRNRMHKSSWPIDVNKKFNLIKPVGGEGWDRILNESFWGEGGVVIHAPHGSDVRAPQGGEIIFENVLHLHNVRGSAHAYIKSGDVIWRIKNIDINSIPEKFKENIRPGRYYWSDFSAGGYWWEKEAPVEKVEEGEKIGEIFKWDDPNLPKSGTGQDDHIVIEAIHAPESEWKSGRDFMIEFDSYREHHIFRDSEMGSLELDPILLFRSLFEVKNVIDKETIKKFTYPSDFAMKSDGISQLIEAQRLREIAQGYNDFSAVYQVDGQGPLSEYVIKVPFSNQKEEKFLAMKKTMGGIIADFNIVQNVKIRGIRHRFVVLQKKLKIFDNVNRLSEIKDYVLPNGEKVDLGILEKNLLEEMVKRGIYYSDALIPKNYGLDELTGKLYLIDFGGAMIIRKSDPEFEKYSIFIDKTPFSYSWRQGNYKKNFYKDTTEGRYFDKIGIPGNDELYNLWGSEVSENYSVPEIDLSLRDIFGFLRNDRNLEETINYLMSFGIELSILELIRKLVHRRSFRIGDFGAGQGIALKEILDEFPGVEVYAVDLENVKGRDPRINFYQEDFGTVQLDEKVDLALFIASLYYTDKQIESLLNVFNNNLAIGGTLTGGLIFKNDAEGIKARQSWINIFDELQRQGINVIYSPEEEGRKGSAREDLVSLGFWITREKESRINFEKIRADPRKIDSEGNRHFSFMQVNYSEFNINVDHAMIASSARGRVNLDDFLYEDGVDSLQTHGGIDFTTENISLTTQGGGVGFMMPADFENLTPQNIQGLVPVIINIVPVKNLNIFFGFKREKDFKLTQASSPF